MAYSPFFKTLHDEKSPVGYLGRGTHHSILRAMVFNDLNLKPTTKGSFLDFAVIWDEDHDIRVVEVVEKLYAERLLAPIRVIGERKGMLSVLLSSEVTSVWGEKKFNDYAATVERHSSCSNDQWTADVSVLHKMGTTIINDDPNKVSIYLKNIENLWELGLKPVTWPEITENFPDMAVV